MPSRTIPSTAGTSTSRSIVRSMSSVTTLGDTIADARKRAYQAMEKIHFDGMHYRKDIGHQAIKL